MDCLMYIPNELLKKETITAITAVYFKSTNVYSGAIGPFHGLNYIQIKCLLYRHNTKLLFDLVYTNTNDLLLKRQKMSHIRALINWPIGDLHLNIYLVKP